MYRILFQNASRFLLVSKTDSRMTFAVAIEYITATYRINMGPVVDSVDPYYVTNDI